MSQAACSHDVVIVGGGPAGLCFAAALRGLGLRIVVIERQPQEVLADPPYDGREIALTLKSVGLLSGLGVWDRIPEGCVSPLRGARVFNGDSLHALNLKPPASASPAIGYLVSNSEIRRAAYENVRGICGITLIPGCEVVALSASEANAQVELSDGTVLTARLVVAADSRHSQSRRTLGIPADMTDFGKSMLVCRMNHATSGDRIAWEWFGHRQTLALLPISDDCSSVVVTLPHDQIRRLMRLEPSAFALEMAARFQDRLGVMSLASERFEYPLVAVYARRFSARRYAVVGDAAVGMHPVTAHGFNFGLLGQDTLARLIRRAIARGGDIANPSLLAAYDRAHRRATLPLYLATNAIVRLYTADSPPSRFAREALLGAARHFRPISSLLTALLTHRGNRATSGYGR